MAVLKHIKSKNANYSDAIDYLLFQHDENNGKKILDDSGRPIIREEYYIDGLLCTPESFDKECEITNKKFHKNQNASDIKSHHYIISYDPADVTECGLTGVKKHQALSLALAKKIFPGYQALIVTHTDGHNNSGNIHTHIVINSVRKCISEGAPYMSQPMIMKLDINIEPPINSPNISKKKLWICAKSMGCTRWIYSPRLRKKSQIENTGCSNPARKNLIR